MKQRQILSLSYVVLRCVTAFWYYDVKVIHDSFTGWTCCLKMETTIVRNVDIIATFRHWTESREHSYLSHTSGAQGGEGILLLVSRLEG